MYSSATKNEVYKQLDELEAMFKYMGSAHPEFEKTKNRIEQLNQMLRQLEATLALLAVSSLRKRSERKMQCVRQCSISISTSPNSSQWTVIP